MRALPPRKYALGPVTEAERALLELEETCQRLGRPYPAAEAMVRRLTEGVSPAEAAAIVGRLLEGRPEPRRRRGPGSKGPYRREACGLCPFESTPGRVRKHREEKHGIAA